MLILHLFLACIAGSEFVRESSGQVFYSWNNPAGGDYGSAGNWLPGAGAPPDAIDGAEFGFNATYTVDFFADFAIAHASVSAGNVTWDLGQGSGLQRKYMVGAVEVTSGAQLQFFDGNVIANTMLISGGADVLVLGADRNDAAHITVTGTGSSLTHDNFLEVANYRPETLTIENGGTVTSGSGSVGSDPFFDSEGIVNVTGAGSIWTTGNNNLDVGDFSKGVLNILEGGAVSNRFGNIGFSGEGTVNVSGTGSTWTNTSDLYVSRDKDGALNITTGGKVTSVRGLVGSGTGADGTVLVSGAGATWTNSGQLFVGDTSEATGHLTIADGGKVSNSNGIIGNEGVFSTFPASVGTVDVSGPESTWTNSGDLTVGQLGIGTLNIANGATVSNNVGFVAHGANSEGSVTVGGAGSTWASSGFLHVGRQGTATLAITEGGKVTNFFGLVGGTNASQPGGSGAVSVNGAGSTWSTEHNVHIGHLGSGTLTIENGGNVTNANGFLGVFSGSTGTATVTGVGSTWTNIDSINIGNFGNGTLIVEEGGAVTNTDGHIGPSPGSTGTVTIRGAGSTWNMTGELFLGAQGTGNLTIENGGRVTSNSGNIARAGGLPFGVGSVTVTGAGSTWTNTNELRVGNNGVGTLNITGGAAVSNKDAYIATTAGSTATATIGGADATWNVDGRLSVGGDANTATSGGNGALDINSGGNVNVAQDTVIFPNGIVRLQGGTLDTSAVSFQGAGGQFQWTGGKLHVGIFNGNLVNQCGSLAPGHSPGLTTVVGNYTQQSAGSLEIEIGGSAAFDNDLVNVVGTASLGGLLQPALINGFTPTAAQTFSVMQAANLIGAFSNVANGQRVATTDNLGSFQVNYGLGSAFNPNQVVLSNYLANPLGGDFNNDGLVDAADYVMWRKLGLGAVAYGDWRRNYGPAPISGSGGGAEVTVPEPGVIALIIAGMFGFFPQRRPRLSNP